MKKLFAMFVVAGMVAFVACGPSAEEKAEQQRIQDSIAQDSIANLEKAQQAKLDSIDQVKNDSIATAAHADSVAKKLIK
jgi:protein tyrosine/serine phosphatase